MASPPLPRPGKLAASEAQDFALQPDGTVRCPANQTLSAHERRKEADGSLRVIYAASIRSCRPWPDATSGVNGMAARPRSRSLRECASASTRRRLCSAAASRDWSRREHRRACLQLVRHQRIEVSLPPPTAASPGTADVILSRAQRAHSRLCWQERLARNARVSPAGQVTIKLFGVPEHFATSLGLATA